VNNNSLIIIIRLILSTELSAKNKMQAIGSLAIPVLRQYWTEKQEKC
jgi:hypothetical protein